ncbi:putative long-chain-alcohol O-fatty-acyltransferase [Lupinus albus]|uniref:Putative long-chain-alcohol O-fatty-acyltransferase n=1 Tax=Lupinus albus TaxID=3870 RepID=A0A6A4NRB1_LUPAL|nr:putative long-chain-alcohol O-fatty-acyltransferase [Lupinus albus]
MDHVDREINNFIMVWTIVASTMCYCHTIGKFIPQGKTTILAIFLAIFVLLLLPLRLTSVHLGGPTSFIFAWLTTFKLLLFALGKGPLSSNPPLSLAYFICLSLLPIKLFQQHQPNLSNT